MPESDDSIDFFARYKGLVVARSIVVNSQTDNKDVAAYLANVRSEIDKRGFEVLGISLGVLDAYAAVLTKDKAGYASLVEIYKALGSQDTEKEINNATKGDEQIKPFAKAYLLRSSMHRLGLQYYLSSDSKLFNQKAQKQKASSNVPFESEGISFMAKYGQWVSIKKLSIHPDTKPEEVAAHFSSIRIAIDRKVPAILGIDVDGIDVFADAITANMRKSAANLEKVASAMQSADARAKIKDVCKTDGQLEEAASAYMLGRMLQNLKVNPEVSPDTLMDMFPGLKIPKPKGRMPGQKKKKQ